MKLNGMILDRMTFNRMAFNPTTQKGGTTYSCRAQRRMTISNIILRIIARRSSVWKQQQNKYH